MKPLAYGIPFVIVGCHKFLARLRKMGFKTFHPYIDESYDNESDLASRVDKAFKSFEEYIKKDKPLKEIQNICDHNRSVVKKIQARQQGTSACATTSITPAASCSSRSERGIQWHHHRGHCHGPRSPRCHRPAQVVPSARRSGKRNESIGAVVAAFAHLNKREKHRREGRVEEFLCSVKLL